MFQTRSLKLFWTPRRTWGALLLGLLMGVVFLLPLGPHQKGFFPICVLNKTTGLHCPGCGATRASHALIRGDIAAAFASNPLFVLFVPFFAYLAIRSGWPALVRNKWKPVACSTKILIPLAFLVLAYGVVRNLEHPALAWMAP